jgi:hypothetical protein
MYVKNVQRSCSPTWGMRLTGKEKALNSAEIFYQTWKNVLTDPYERRLIMACSG